MRLDSVVILGSARTAIGSFGGSLAGLAPHELGTVTAREALARAGVEAGAIDHAVYGHIITTGPQDAYLARHIALDAGVPEGAAAFNVNRLCGSGVQAILSAAQQIVLGDSRLALAGGADGLDGHRAVAPWLAGLLVPKGAVFLEIGAGQEPAVAAIVRRHGLQHVETMCDLGGIPRCLVAVPGTGPNGPKKGLESGAIPATVDSR